MGLLGRERETARVAGVIDAVRRSRSDVLVVRGEAGIGKSALLRHARCAADGVLLLTAEGVERESQLAYAGLHQLLRPVLQHAERLPEHLADALRRAFGLVPGLVQDRFLVSLATLALLAEVAEERGALCVVDDAQWLDPPTVDALAFVARRLGAEGVGLLLGVRDDEHEPEAMAGLPELQLEGLDPAAASALLVQSAGRQIAPDVRGALVEAAAGNALALVELPRSLTDDQLCGREALPDPLPVGAGVERALLRRARRLSIGAQTLLLLIAADGSGDLITLHRAADALGLAPVAWQHLEEAGLVRIEPAHVAVTHPLVRSAAYRAATPAERRAAHHALAAAMSADADADRRAWHRASATVGPDDEIADALEESAVRARLRSGHASAAAALERAAQLTTDPAERGRRLVGAAEARWMSGRTERIAALLDQADPLVDDPHVRALAAGVRGAVELGRGALAEAYDVLVRGAREIAQLDPARALEMLVAASEAALWLGSGEGQEEVARLAAAVDHDGRDEETFMVSMIVGTAAFLRGDHERGVPALERAVALADGFEHPRYLIAAGQAAVYLGDLGEAHPRYARAVERLRSAGYAGELVGALELLASVELALGRLQSATANASEALRLARETGRDGHGTAQLATLAHVAALRGDDVACRAHVREIVGRGAGRELPLHAALACWASGRLALGRGEAEEALVALQQIADPAEPLSHPLIARFSAPDRAEALVLAGRAEEAREVLDGIERWGRVALRPWHAITIERLRALLSEGEDADAHFEASIGAAQRARMRLEQARGRLLYGHHLQQTGRYERAVTELQVALVEFEAVGAEQWATRTHVALGRCGEAAARGGPAALDVLTPEELQIARQAVRGATPREIADRLFLGPRTVEHHLRRVHEKLGVSSREGLADALRRDEAPERRLTFAP